MAIILTMPCRFHLTELVVAFRPVVDELITDIESKGNPGRVFQEALQAEITKVEAELAAR